MTSLPELDDQALLEYLLGMSEEERTTYIAGLDDADQARVTSLLWYDVHQEEEEEEEAGEVPEQAEDAYPDYETHQQPTDHDTHYGSVEQEEEEDADSQWHKAPSTDENVLPDAEQLLGRQIDEILSEDANLRFDPDQEETDEDEQTEGDTDLDIRSDREQEEEEEEQTEDADEELDIRPEIDTAALWGPNRAAVAAIVRRDATNRTTSFMRSPEGHLVIGNGHSPDVVAAVTANSVRGSIRFSRNRLSANDFIVENTTADVDYETLEVDIRMLLAGMPEYDYGDEKRVRVK